MNQTPKKSKEGQMEVSTIINLALGYERGQNLIELPTALGGQFFDDEVIVLAAQMEDVMEIFAHRGEKKKFFQDLLQVLEKANEKGFDPIEAVKAWLEAWLEIPD